VNCRDRDSVIASQRVNASRLAISECSRICAGGDHQGVVPDLLAVSTEHPTAGVERGRRDTQREVDVQFSECLRSLERRRNGGQIL